MNNPDPSFSVNVDVTNPGQFFACCGLLELAHRLWAEGNVEGWFDDGAFRVVVPASAGDALADLLARLTDSEIRPDDSRGDKTLRPIHLNCVSNSQKITITLDWWIDRSGKKTPLTLWAGQQTSQGIVEKLRHALNDIDGEDLDKVFDAGKPLTGRFGVDPRAAWEALDVGFSPNTQQMEVATFPAVELLAAVGLQGFRPVQDNNHGFLYATWSVPLPAPVARAACGCTVPVGKVRRYRFEIARRGSYKGFDFAIEQGEDYA